ncbi:MAG: dTDP-4-dehydrorhamnose reductase [Actinomycetes bacterium]|jgi:dTDP-4-dehydrorhamnose reductase|nr:MAG: dTDP-4-dehydrorhamnose reductase [Actinomycetota bacterium]
MIVVLGANGQLGSAFVRLLGREAIPVTRGDLDLADTGTIVPWLEHLRPDLVINCAAYTAVDQAEKDPDTARRVNATAVGELARGTAAIGARLVTFSTDYVFDGNKGRPYVESDPTSPINVYGSTKEEGERLALEADPQALVIRTSWVMSGTHQNFIRTILRLMHAGPVRVVDDQVGRPTFADDLAAGTMRVLDAGLTGIVHLTNAGQTTWWGLSREIAAMAGLEAEVVPITTAESGRLAARPADSRLDSERLAAAGVASLPHYRESLERAVRQQLEGGVLL